MLQAVAHQTDTYIHRIKVRKHVFVVDEPRENGGSDEGPSPLELLAASLASCTAMTMELYATRKGWDISDVEVECSYSPAQRGAATRFHLVLRLPNYLSDEQAEWLRTVAAKCPVHRTLDGEVIFTEQIVRRSDDLDARRP